MHKAILWCSKHNIESTFFLFGIDDDLRNINGGPVVTFSYPVKDVSHKRNYNHNQTMHCKYLYIKLKIPRRIARQNE